MTEERDIERIVADLDSLIKGDGSGVSMRELAALIADWRAKKAEIARLSGLVDFYRKAYPTEAELAQR